MRNTVTMLLFTAIFLTGGISAIGPLYTAPVVCPGGSYFYNVRSADMNKDGFIDIVVSDLDDNNITIFLGQYGGTFAPAVAYDIGGGALSLAVVDLDKDGDEDVIVGREVGYDDYLGVLFNNGDGTLAAPVDYEVYNTPYDIVAGDVDGDNNTDVLIATHYVVQLFRNQGDGTLDAAVDFNAATGMNTGLALADFDGDDDLDFAVNNYEIDSTQVFLNGGTGNFTSAGRYYSGNSPNCLDAAMFNNDAYPDLVATNRSASTISVLMNDGDGTFAAPAQYTVGFDAYWADPVDLDGDSDIDLAVATWVGKGASVLLNDGTGVFGTATNYILAENPSVASGDFDKDGDPDLATVPSGDAVVILHNTGDGSFVDAQKYPTGTKSWGTAMGDLDGDNYLDIAVANFTSNSVTTLINNGDSTFTPGTISGLPAGAGPSGLALADLNSDFSAEMIIADFSKDSITVKNFASPGATNYPAGDGPSAVAAGFLNNDAYIDVAVINENGLSLSVYLNDGSGSLLAPASYPTTDTPYGIAIGDIDGDDDNDIALANTGSYGSCGQRIYLNDGAGAFTPGPDIPITYWGNSVTIDDIDDDDDNDLIYTQDDSRITVYKNNGNGTFTDSTGYDLSYTPTGIFLADFDMDGYRDLATSNKWDGYIAIWFNQGNGDFAHPAYFRLGKESKAIAGGDLDGDGDIDLAASTSTDSPDTLRIFWNQKELIPVDADGLPQNALPALFSLRQNYPNPFNPSTTIAYSLPRAADVTLTIYNLLGQTVQTLNQGNRPAGQYQVIWDGKDEGGRAVASGIYFYRLTAGDYAGAKKMLLIK